jgi:predicted RNA binding protein YcfA (HicA-like mRNA interferase family)
MFEPTLSPIDSNCVTSARSSVVERARCTLKAKRLLSALLRAGWTIKRESGSHRTLSREGWPDVVFAFHDSDEIGPRMVARVAKNTGLRPEDL